MSNIRTMDCTLRDGGYVNDWKFGRDNIIQTAKKLCEAALDYIECGFLSQKKPTSENQSIFRTIEEADAAFCKCQRSVALMINCGEYDPADIPPYGGGATQLLRIAFHKHQIEEAKTLCIALQEKGYRVFFQPMVTSGYSDGEILSLISLANELMPEAFYIVDSFGMMRKKEVLHYFRLFDENLAPAIKIGFHSHNNLQLSFSNAQELMQTETQREIIIDSSVFGMGRGAGNLCTELLTQYINENIEYRYDLIPILEIMDEVILPIYTNKPWGYSAPYYIAAVNGCHPNYATDLINRQTLCIRDINAIIKKIPQEKKQLFDQKLIAKMYLDYQKHMVDDGEVLESLRELIRDRNVLLLAPGRSLCAYKGEISRFIEGFQPVVFAVNHIPEKFPFDRVFISNLRRFRRIGDAEKMLGEKLLCTSNISNHRAPTVNYSSYLSGVDVISDNAGLMLINVLKKAGAKKLYLAGFDGFDVTSADNYFDENLSFDVQYRNFLDMNTAMKTFFENLSKNLEVVFITPSIYRDDV